jgi:hypothetical protein
MTSRRLLAFFALALILPTPAEAQSGTRIRAAVSGQSFVAGDYGNTDMGQAFDVAFLFGKKKTKMGFAVEYGEYTITGEPEAVVDAALDFIVDIPLSGRVYLDLRFGINSNGWDVADTRFTVGGGRGGGALGYRFPVGGNLALDAALTGSYFYGIWSTAGSDTVSEFVDDIDVTGTRFGLRVGLTLNPGVIR